MLLVVIVLRALFIIIIIIIIVHVPYSTPLLVVVLYCTRSTFYSVCRGIKTNEKRKHLKFDRSGKNLDDQMTGFVSG